MRPPSNFSASGLQRIPMLRRPNRFMKPNPAEMLIRPFEREDKNTYYFTGLSIYKRLFKTSEDSSEITVVNFTVKHCKAL